MGNKKYNKTMPSIRILVSFYLLWTSFNIVKGILSGDAEASPFMIIAVILFVVCSIFFIVTSTRELKRIEKEEKEEAKREALENPQEEEESKLQPEGRKLSIRERARLAKDLQVPEGVVDEIEDEDQPAEEGDEEIVADKAVNEPVADGESEATEELEVEREEKIVVEVVSAEDVQVVAEGDNGEIEVVAEVTAITEEDEEK